MTKSEAIRQYVLETYIATGEHIFISAIASAMKTNASTVRKALDEEINGFEYLEADQWSRSKAYFTDGKFIQSWAVEPSKRKLIQYFSAKA